MLKQTHYEAPSYKVWEVVVRKIFCGSTRPKPKPTVEDMERDEEEYGW